MLTAAQLAAGGASLLLGGAIAWLVLSEFPVINPGRPTTTGGALTLLEASPITIDEFEKFRVNDENPFIPFNLRQSESQQKKIERSPSSKKPPVKAPPVEGEVVAAGPKPLPRLPAPGQSGPIATGLLISKDGPQALLTFPGESHATLMKPGDTVNGWTVVEVSDGNVVRVKDVATGTIQALVVPDSQATAAPDDGRKPADKKADGAKPGAKPGAGAQAANGKPGQGPGQGEGKGQGKAKKRKNQDTEGEPGERQQPMPPAADPGQPGPPAKPADKML